MAKFRRAVIAALAVAALTTPMALAQQDAKGRQDHKLIGRFAGSFIVLGEVKAFDERVIQSGKLGDNDAALGPNNSITRSGMVTNLVYEAPTTSSSLEIAVNYGTRLEALGYKPI